MSIPDFVQAYDMAGGACYPAFFPCPRLQITPHPKLQVLDPKTLLLQSNILNLDPKLSTLAHA